MRVRSTPAGGRRRGPARKRAGLADPGGPGSPRPAEAAGARPRESRTGLTQAGAERPGRRRPPAPGPKESRTGRPVQARRGRAELDRQGHGGGPGTSTAGGEPRRGEAETRVREVPGVRARPAGQRAPGPGPPSSAPPAYPRPLFCLPLRRFRAAKSARFNRSRFGICLPRYGAPTIRGRVPPEHVAGMVLPTRHRSACQLGTGFFPGPPRRGERAGGRGRAPRVDCGRPAPPRGHGGGGPAERRPPGEAARSGTGRGTAEVPGGARREASRGAATRRLGHGKCPESGGPARAAGPAVGRRGRDALPGGGIPINFAWAGRQSRRKDEFPP